MGEVVYILCAFTSLACGAFLFRAYRIRKTALLLWSSLCFMALAFNNVLLVVDLMVFPEVNLSILRTLVLLAGFGLLLYGLIWEKA